MLKMAKIILIVASFILVAASALAKVTITNDGAKKVYKFEVETVTFDSVNLNKTKYMNANIEGVEGYNASLERIGFPKVPSISFYVNADSEKDIQFIFDPQKHVKGMNFVSLQIAPAQESAPKIKGAKAPFVKNRAFYAKSSFYPMLKYRVDFAGSSRGQAKQLVTIYPFSYNPKTREYKVDRNFSIVVKENSSPKVTGVETFAFIIGEKYSNSPSLQSYIELKESLGYNVEKITVGTDAITPDEIRTKLQEIYHNPKYDLRYALIIGDIEDVPSVKAKTLSYHTFVTDHYYRSIDTDDYMSDLNAPDIGLGRVTVKSESELTNVLSKFTKYTMGTFGRTDWFDHPSFIATDDRYDIVEKSHNYAIDNFFTDAGYTGSFPNEVQPGADKLYAITHRVSDAIVNEKLQKGRFLINYSGHGGTKKWDGPHIYQKDVRALTDTDVLPFVIANSCITGQFVIEESFAETWIKHPAGAIFYWGSMDRTYWEEDDILEKNVYHGIFDDGNRTFSSITQHGLSSVWKFYAGKNRSKYYWETYHAFGDPSIEFRMRAPKAINVDIPKVIPFGETETEATVTDIDGNPVQGLRVAVTHIEGSSKNVRYTNFDGKVVLPLVGAKVAENYKVIVYGNDYQTSSSTIFIEGLDTPFYMIEDFSIDGSENLAITAHQEFSLSMIIKNISPISSTGGKLEIVSIDGNATVILAEQLIPALKGNEKKRVTGLRLKAGAFHEEGSIALTLRWTSNEGKGREFIKNIAVERGILAITAVDFGDTVHPQDGGMAPLESGNIWVTFSNTGGRVVTRAELTPISLSKDFDIGGMFSIPSLAPGDSIRMEVPFDVTLLQGADDNEELSFQVLGVHSGEFGTEKLKAEGSFVVGKYGFRTSEFIDIGLRLLDRKVVVYEFGGPEGISSIKDFAIHIKIKHTFVGDLVLTLVHPSGKEVILRKNVGGNADGIDEVYGVGLPALEELYGLPASGIWKLKIYDRTYGDIGTLEYIKIDMKGLL
ncbi:MAG: proprotein convertase P-domain-containing protein [Bacteriovoracaceae bacterium]|nr:proprotein convertase P-domain-containing protein [Bacteriovoracaceae bacterium]